MAPPPACYGTSTSVVVFEGREFISHSLRFPTWVRDLKQSFFRFPAAPSACLSENIYLS